MKQWEKTANAKCRLVMLLGGGNMPTSTFIGYAHYKGEKWLFSVTSQLELDTFIKDMQDYKVSENIILTQVVPPQTRLYPSSMTRARFWAIRSTVLR